MSLSRKFGIWPGGRHEGCKKRGGVCDCAGRQCAVDARGVGHSHDITAFPLGYRCAICGEWVEAANADACPGGEERCAYCGECKGPDAFEDGLRCRVCAEGDT